MQNILEELYFGNVHQNSELYANNSAYAEAVQLKKINYENLLTTLNESEKELLEKYLAADAELKELQHFSIFTYAFRFGSLLMTEIFTGMNQITGER